MRTRKLILFKNLVEAMSLPISLYKKDLLFSVLLQSHYELNHRAL